MSKMDFINSYLSIVTSSIQEHIELANRMDKLTETVILTAQLIIDCLRQGNKVLICGNGGSAADAQHLAAELVGRFTKERRAYPVVALTTNTSVITSIGNDYTFDRVFARQVEAYGRSGDVLVAISTSGNSNNVLYAAQVARDLDIKVIGFTGDSGGQLKGLCDMCLCVPASNTPRIQEMHILLGHIICHLVEEALC